MDCFYCHKDVQRQGVGRQLYDAMEDKAVSLSLRELTVEASITAKPFFESMGFRLVREQVVECRGEQLTNFAMTKTLKRD